MAYFCESKEEEFKRQVSRMNEISSWVQGDWSATVLSPEGVDSQNSILLWEIRRDTGFWRSTPALLCFLHQGRDGFCPSAIRFYLPGWPVCSTSGSGQDRLPGWPLCSSSGSGHGRLPGWPLCSSSGSGHGRLPGWPVCSTSGRAAMAKADSSGSDTGVMAVFPLGGGYSVCGYSIQHS